MSLKRIKIFFIFVSIIYLSGCAAALLAIPAGGIIAHTIQLNNEEYENIIVNMGYGYKQYYKKMEELNKNKEALGKPKEEILTFEKWIETQAKTEKERKAVERYKRIHANNP